jgi:hypothetical protein
MIPPILQTDWMNRVAFDPESGSPQVESFYLKANDPKHPRAIWIRLSLYGAGKDRYGETQAIYFDGAAGKNLVASERWPVGRVQIDPERAGVGIGESNIQEAASAGLVRGNDFALSWDLELEDDSPGYYPFPAEWLYRSRRVSSKIVTPHPSATVHLGALEVWHGLQRHVDHTRIDLAGWRAMQGHTWGSRLPERYAWAHCNTFKEAPAGSYFELYAGEVKLAGLLSPQALVGRLVLDREVYRFDTWRNLFGAPGRYSPTDWAFELQGPDGTLKGKVTATVQNTVALKDSSPGAASRHCFNSKLARLSLELTPLDGPKRLLTSEHASYETGQPEPRGALNTTAGRAA